MKKLILTSQNIVGEIQVLYGVDMKLVMFDLMNADLNEDQIDYFKKKAPIFFTNRQEFKKAFNSDALEVMEVEFEVTFDMFYEAYPKKVNKYRCEPLWNKFSESMKIKAYAGVARYKRHLAEESWRAVLDPENYLKKKAWLNDWK